jgi:hypothetical protein
MSKTHTQQPDWLRLRRTAGPQLDRIRYRGCFFKDSGRRKTRTTGEF